MYMSSASKRSFVFASIFLLVISAAPVALAQVQFVGLGDSIGEGVQSADANEATQHFSYLNLISLHVGTPFPLPLIRTSFFAMVGDTSSRFRIAPGVASLDLAVSGADVFSLLNDRADATTVAQINSETDLVLFPRLGSQMEIAESLRPTLVACWIGNNDVLGAVTAFDQMDVSQMTSVADFYNNFLQIAARLKAMNSKVVFGTIPDVSRIGFLLDRTDLIRLLGSDFGMPETSRTSVVAMLMIGLGLADPSILQNPSYVLDATELSMISQRITIFNQIITGGAASYGHHVADIHGRFEQFGVNPPVVFGIPLTNKFLGGLFSLDGVHPSNIAHAFVANEFITTFNASYGLSIPLIDPSLLTHLFITDPFVDLNRNGRVRGRPFAGLLETVALFLGFSGDTETFPLTATSSQAPSASAGLLITPAGKKKFLDEYEKMKGKDLTKASPQEVRDAFREIFGLDRFRKKR